MNDEGSAISKFLISKNIRVVTDDSLLVSSSLTVRRLVSLLSSIDNPDDTMARYLARHLEVEIPQSYSSIIDLCEDLLRKLKAYNPEVFDAEVLYVQSFMDLLRDHCEKNGNNLHSFLKDWAETKSRKENISSPKVGDAVRIMTMHKSKGLDFRYVIVPYVEKIGLFRHDSKWCKPDVSGTALDGVAKGIYDVTLSGKSEETLFAPHFREEMLLQYVDNVNVLYVALTRARECMEIIAEDPGERCDRLKVKDMDVLDLSAFENFADVLYWYANVHGEELGMLELKEDQAEEDSRESEHECFVYGELPQAERKPEEDSHFPMTAGFHSWPLNAPDDHDDAPVNERGRLKFSSDALDFFSEDGSAGVDASQRIKGIVLHDILSDVCVPEELDKAVDSAVISGSLSLENASQVKEILARGIESVMSEGWFPAQRSCVLNEMEITDVDGRVYRPDRVIRRGRKVIIVDYKFGEHHAKYERQLKSYADLWERMGYEVESASLWYVLTGDIVRVL
jgi:ATP-dependent exoDNAse (exonuclease V) beta subunit